MKPTTIGGQAVMGGVMMRSPERIALAVRKENGAIAKEITREGPPLTKKYKLFGIPVIRGVVSFVESLSVGMSTMSRAAEIAIDEVKEQENSKKKDGKPGNKETKGEIAIVIIVAIILAVGIFMILPSFLTGLLKDVISNSLVMNLIDGLLRLGIFIAYVAGIGQISDIRDVFRYHGAEHKTISCYEHERPLSVENAREFTTAHPRCGTTYMLLVVVLSIVAFSLLGWSDGWIQRIALRLLMLPVVAGLAYELMKLSAKYENIFTKIIRAPGMMLQKLTTKQPDDSMLEVAIAAFELALTGEMQPEEAVAEEVQPESENNTEQ